ncbi:glycosyltransferase family 4 protein [Sphingobium aromaticiconvertens]|uniref:glycosyltransferase family 4 protein n=1 Tax=Sphingobium aromaticiconvertens TaxID=365341 RepID=UPI003019B756
MKIVMLSSLSYSLINFRGALLRSLVEQGNEVVACAPDFDPVIVSALDRMGIRFRLTPMARAGTNPFRDIETLAHYLRLLRQERPDAVIAYTQKPIIYGGLAMRLLRLRGFHALMSGLGYVYSPEADHRWLLRRFVSRLYRAGVARAAAIFVFNGDDRRMMMDNGIIGYDHHVIQIGGSGIDTAHFSECPLPRTPPVFLMIARLMRDKGVPEFVEAARIVKAHHPQARFQLLGRMETETPTGCKKDELAEWVASGLIEHLPETRDVRPDLAKAHVFVLPSFYREGLPRTLLEALAMGRPVITTDTPGCREPVEPGVNGWLVRPRDSQALANAMLDALQDRARLVQMASNARRTAVERYDVEKVNAQVVECLHLSARLPRAGVRQALSGTR